VTFSRGNRRGAKLSPGQVLELREAYAAGETQGSLARKYGVSVGQVGRIVRGESWGEARQDDINASLARLKEALAAEPDVLIERIKGGDDVQGSVDNTDGGSDTSGS
jgi:uncharacterized protein YjcR